MRRGVNLLPRVSGSFVPSLWYIGGGQRHGERSGQGTGDCLGGNNSVTFGKVGHLNGGSLVE